jgi:hypothetical protein
VIEVNILIMRAFVKLREIISTHKIVEEKIKELEEKIGEHNNQIIEIIEVINQLILLLEKPVSRTGFEVREKVARYAAKQK